MDKILCRNNLSTIGKWGGASFLFGVVITAFVFGGNIPLRAYASETIIPVNQQNELKLDFNSIGKINDITLPVNDLINNAISGLRLNQGVGVNIGTNIPVSPIKSPSQNIDFSKFFSSSAVSSGDIMSFLKEAVITGINLSILVISITSQVLRGLLDAIK